jgi:hypothetical protein
MEKISKDKTRLTVTEYELRWLDLYGDSQDVIHCETEAEAREYVRRDAFATGIAAWVIEKHVTRYPAYLFADASVYTKIGSGGDLESLHMGGWIG